MRTYEIRDLRCSVVARSTMLRTIQDIHVHLYYALIVTALLVMVAIVSYCRVQPNIDYVSPDRPACSPVVVTTSFIGCRHQLGRDTLEAASIPCFNTFF